MLICTQNGPSGSGGSVLSAYQHLAPWTSVGGEAGLADHVVHPGLGLSELAELFRPARHDIAFLRPSPQFRPPASIAVREVLADRLVCDAGGPSVGGRPARDRHLRAVWRTLPGVPRGLGCGLFDHATTLCNRAGFAPNVAQEAREATMHRPGGQRRVDFGIAADLCADGHSPAHRRLGRRKPHPDGALRRGVVADHEAVRGVFLKGGPLPARRSGHGRLDRPQILEVGSITPGRLRPAACPLRAAACSASHGI